MKGSSMTQRQKQERHEEKFQTRNLFNAKSKPLDDIQFNCDEEIKVPISVELRHKDAKVPKKSHLGSCCYHLKSLQTYRL